MSKCKAHYPCPYDPSCMCAMDEPCLGCESCKPDGFKSQSDKIDATIHAQRKYISELRALCDGLIGHVANLCEHNCNEGNNHKDCELVCTVPHILSEYKSMTTDEDSDGG